MVVPIILFGSPILRKNSIEITEEDDYQKYTDDLFNTIRKAEGIGLAAPQISLSKRIFVIDTTPLVGIDTMSVEKFEGVFINPVILDREREKVSMSEGCLSIPGIYEEVIRSQKIYVRYMDLQLKVHEEELDGLKARIFQHEYDHLQGILFVDRINILRRKLLTGKLNRIKKGKII